MPDRRTATLSSRKQPRQARSMDLVAAILDAAVQVLQAEGAGRFTTARVASRAGVSVGSLYQYFPNKAAILFRLQADEWRRTGALLSDILQDGATSPHDRLRRLVHVFLRSECDEAAIRTALGDAAPLYRGAPEAHDARAKGREALATFLCEALPDVPDATRMIAGTLIGTVLSAMGKQVSDGPQEPTAVAASADATADMFCAYLDRLAQASPASCPGGAETGIAPRPRVKRAEVERARHFEGGETPSV